MSSVFSSSPVVWPDLPVPPTSVHEQKEFHLSLGHGVLRKKLFAHAKKKKGEPWHDVLSPNTYQRIQDVKCRSDFSNSTLQEVCEFFHNQIPTSLRFPLAISLKWKPENGRTFKHRWLIILPCGIVLITTTQADRATESVSSFYFPEMCVDEDVPELRATRSVEQFANRYTIADEDGNCRQCHLKDEIVVTTKYGKENHTYVEFCSEVNWGFRNSLWSDEDVRTPQDPVKGDPLRLNPPLKFTLDQS